MIKLINILGVIAIIIGLIAGILCVFTGGVFYAIPVGLIGFITTTIYIGLNMRHQVNTQKLNPGIYALLLNSIPLIYMLIGILVVKFKT